MSERPDRCDTCRFWQAAEDVPPSEEGWCHRHAPAPVINEVLREQGIASAEVVWPFTLRDDWCGEWGGKGQPAGNGDTVTLTADQQALLLRPLAALDLPTRQRRAIVLYNRDEGVELVGELVARTADELLGWRNFGPTSLAIVRAKLAERGLRLRGD